MERLYKNMAGAMVAACLVFALADNAQAQRGRGMMRGGFGFGGPRMGFGFGFGGPRIGFGYRPVYVYPRVGFYLNALPPGYYPFYWGPDQYYYYGGTFYRPSNNGYQVTAPPIGAAVPELPRNARPISIDGVQYYEMNGVYYKEGVDEKGKKVFIVSGKDGVLNTNDTGLPTDSVAVEQHLPQVGDVVDKLPDGCRKVTLAGKKYFVSPDDVYYEEFTDANQNTSYRVTSVPETEEPVKQDGPVE